MLRLLFLLVALLIVGSFAPTPACACSPGGTWAAPTNVKNDLRNMATQQESFHVDHNRYATSLEELFPGGAGKPGWTSAVYTISRVDSLGYFVSAVDEYSKIECTMDMTNAEEPGPSFLRCSLLPLQVAALKVYRGSAVIVAATLLLMLGLVATRKRPPVILAPFILLLVPYALIGWDYRIGPCESATLFYVAGAIAAGLTFFNYSRVSSSPVLPRTASRSVP